ncbi:hypothetical protein I7I51_02652 [Histoplasma capsulatum]|uniref:Uncharacterized protein n=1 Tax=Ajellomyces capsulatus TaxID=5037 RepID=A0A8A1MAD4_AJECA|nr:predicted protein [Histoplasma mississippiense (nom. inval.)]EDN04286.1 predicted protein [Histoplasma mississippiense (nom. inval.)]QSS62909.1 hypothetical protein I7I51_02652 [Histoplasma capsulatum]
MSDHPEQVIAQLGSLLNQLAHFFNENEEYLSPDIYKFCYHSLPALEKLTLSKIVAILHTGDQNRSTDDRQDVCGSHNHGDTSSGLTGGSLGNLTYSSGDKELSSDAGGSSGGVVTNVYKVFKLSVATIPGTLQEVLKEWTKNHETFFEDQPQNVPKASGWGALFRKIHQCEVNADVLRIRRRFDLYYFFQSIQNCGYHDGNRWVYRARNTLAKKVIKQSPSLQLKVNNIESKLDLWAELGRGYAEWVMEFNGHPGCLLLLPLDVSETEYTERRYRKHKKSAAQHLIKIGFQNVMCERDLYALGDSIVQGLKDRHQSLVEDAFVSPRAPKRHGECDEFSAKRPCPGLRAEVSEEHQSDTTNECHTSMQLLVAAVTSVASAHDSATQQNITASPPNAIHENLVVSQTWEPLEADNTNNLVYKLALGVEDLSNRGGTGTEGPFIAEGTLDQTVDNSFVPRNTEPSAQLNISPVVDSGGSGNMDNHLNFDNQRAPRAQKSTAPTHPATSSPIEYSNPVPPHVLGYNAPPESEYTTDPNSTRMSHNPLELHYAAPGNEAAFVWRNQCESTSSIGIDADPTMSSTLFSQINLDPTMSSTLFSRIDPDPTMSSILFGQIDSDPTMGSTLFNSSQVSSNTHTLFEQGYLELW